jgi:hypothetical protein
MTPAQASGRYDFVTDVPVQGPTDEGIRAADCWWVQNRLPANKTTCTDRRTGPVPMWANRPASWGGGWPEYGGNGGPNCSPEQVRYGGCAARGFSLDGASDPAASVSSDQQAWVVSTLTNLNTQIGQATGTACASWQDPGANLAAAVGCFQSWYNYNANGQLRTDGVLDQDTLNAIQSTAAAHTSDFPTPYPAAATAAPAAPAPTTAATTTVPEPPPMPIEKKGLSRNAMIGIGVAGAAVLGTVVVVAVKGRKR